jgi:pyruvate,water dikinase
MHDSQSDVINFEDVGRGDVGLVGGKNASLGEMISALPPQPMLFADF